MEVRAFAERVLRSAALEDKLRKPDGALTDDAPGEAVFVSEPARTEDLRFAARRTAPAMPKPGGLRDQRKRAVAHHILANHELQALEVMADVALRFPKAPTEFRLGLARIMQDEQRHTRMHVERAATLGLRFGELPVNSYIWEKSREFESVLDYVATLPLLFEGRNLDHTIEFAGWFEAAGDPRSAALIKTIHRDEIEHVAFGIEWLRQLKPDGLSDWDTFCQHLKWPLRPAKAKGEQFQVEARKQAGLSDEFIEKLRLAQNDDGQQSSSADVAPS
jgi:uncharacterized ferritin-like protein (DUF455 family)